MNEKLLFIHGKFHSLMKLAIKLDQSPKKFGSDELLTHSEVHLIEIIGDNKGVSVTEIAKALGVTKGAVSQGLKKLEQKEYSFKKKDPENLSRALVMLTAKGQTAYWAHKHWHEKMDGGFAKYLQELSDSDLAVISAFLEKTEDFLQRRVRSVE